MTHGRVKIGAVLATVLVVATAACSGSGAETKSADPARAARQFCNGRARREISRSLGVEVVRVTEPRWHGHRYACAYEFPNGTIAVSVTGHASVADAREDFAAIARRRGRRPEPPMLGEELDAFITTDGSMIVRKDRDVLDVDVSHLPTRFGQPAQKPSVIALAVAVTIIGHWVPG